MRLILNLFFSLSILVFGVCFMASRTEADAVEIDYDLSLMGLPLGHADLKGQFDKENYTLSLTARLTGLAGMVTGGRGSANAAGDLRETKVLPRSFAISSRSGDDQRVVRMALRTGDVSAVSIEPPLDEKPDRIPVEERHKRAVLDPVSALIMPVLSGTSGPLDPKNCNRTLPIFDGASRFDIPLVSAGTREIRKPGYQGQVLVCQARYIPISGHRPKRQAVEFMQENRELFVWLAPLSGTLLLLPIRISVKTMIGTSVLEAARIRRDQDATAATALKKK
jgi:hypothetical protein